MVKLKVFIYILLWSFLDHSILNIQKKCLQIVQQDFEKGANCCLSEKAGSTLHVLSIETLCKLNDKDKTFQ